MEWNEIGLLDTIWKPQKSWECLSGSKEVACMVGLGSYSWRSKVVHNGLRCAFIIDQSIISDSIYVLEFLYFFKDQTLSLFYATLYHFVTLF